MNSLAQRIARMIRADGPISIAAFMTIALHDRKAGFYATRESIGARGAFITAPEISQIFGELLGLWCAQVWCDQGAPPSARLVDLGPGRGVLMTDALRGLRRAPEFLAATEIVLVEASPALEGLQRERLRDSPAPICWVRQWTDVQQDRPLFLVANEFLDALAIRQFVMTERGWCERMITTDEQDRLTFALAPMPTSLQPPPQRGAAYRGAVYETSSAAEALVEDIAGAIVQYGGAALLVDYGHEGGAFGETLQAVSGHERADILGLPGQADLSAHVDFAALAHAAGRAGARVCGPLGQGAFLRALGIGARAEKLSAANPHRKEEIAKAVERLTEEMGELFKVIAITPVHAPRPPGF